MGIEFEEREKIDGKGENFDDNKKKRGKRERE